MENATDTFQLHNKCKELAKSRFYAYRNHFESIGLSATSGVVPEQCSFDHKFRKTHLHSLFQQQIQLSFSNVDSSLVDLSGTPIKLDTPVKLQIFPIDEEYIAEICSAPNSSHHTISISYGTLLTLDVIAARLCLHMRNQQEMIKWRRHQFSEEIEKLIVNPIDLSHFCKLVRDANESEISYWSGMVELSLEWILRHEFGHAICGHIDYFTEHYGNIQERRTFEQLEPHQIYGETTPVVHYTSETIADLYATISMFTNMLRGYGYEDSTLSRGNRANIVGTALVLVAFSILGAVLSFYLPTYANWRTKDDGQSATHPKIVSRFLGAMTSLAFLLEPPTDIRFDPESFKLRRLIYDSHEDLPYYLYQHKQLYAALFSSIRFMAMAGMLGNNTDEEFLHNHESITKFAFCLVQMGRMSSDEFNETYFVDIPAGQVLKSAYLHWSAIMRNSGSRICGYFVSHFDGSVIANNKVNNENYFILDDMLAKAQLSSLGVSEFGECTLESERQRHVNLIDVIQKHINAGNL